MSKKLSLTVIKKEKWDTAFLILYALVLIRCTYETTMFPQQILAGTMRYLAAALIMYTGAKIFFSGQYSRKEQVAAIALVGVFGVAAVISGYLQLIELALLVAGAKNVSFKPILKVYVATELLFMLVAAVACRLGYIADVVGYSPRDPQKQRHSYGMIYPTDFAAHVFFLLIVIVILMTWTRKKYSYIIGTVIVLPVAAFIYSKSGAFTSTLCLIGFLILMALLRAFKTLGAVLKYMPVFCALLFMVLSYFYSLENAFMVRLDRLLSQRLQVSNRVWREYDIRLFGQWIEEQGWGGVADPTQIDASKYFYLDDSYIRILFEYGALVFVAAIILMVVIGHKALKTNSIVLFAAIAIIGIHSFMEQHLMELAYNPFVLLLFATLENEGQIREEAYEFKKMDNSVH